MTASGSRSGLCLKAFLVLVAVLLAWGLWRQMGSLGFHEALAQVLDGDLDREGRLEALGVLRDLGSPEGGGDVGMVLVTAMAAVALNDRQAYELAAGQLPPLLVDSAEADLLSRASLGEPCLGSLLAGLVAESRGDTEEARRRYRQAMVSAPLGNLPLAERLATEGLERLR